MSVETFADYPTVTLSLPVVIGEGGEVFRYQRWHCQACPNQWLQIRIENPERAEVTAERESWLAAHQKCAPVETREASE